MAWRHQQEQEQGGLNTDTLLLIGGGVVGLLALGWVVKSVKS